MMKLLLTSAGFENQAVAEAFTGMLSKPASISKVLFIPTAAQTGEALSYVEKSRKELLKAGIDRNNIHIYDLERRMDGAELKKYDVVYVCGGNTRHLLRRVKRSGFDKILISFGGVYVGASAGSLIMAAHIDPYLKNARTKGLRLINCWLRVHCQEGSQGGKIDTGGCPVISLTDRQALVVEDGEVTLIQ